MIALLFILISLVFFLYVLRKQNSSLPPGPRGLPFLGNLLQIGTQPNEKCAEWALEYGNYFTIYLGHKPALVINDAGLIKELLGTLASTGRCQSDFMDVHSWARGHGFVKLQGEAWLEQREFLSQAMTQTGFGQQSQLEPLLTQKIDSICNFIQNHNDRGRKLHLDELLKGSVGSVLCAMVTGEKCRQTQLKFVDLVTSWRKQVQIVTKSGLLFIPWLKHIPPFRSRFQQFKSVCDDIREMAGGYLESHERTGQDGQPTRDLIDAYINKVTMCENKRSTFYGKTGWQHILANVVFMTAAGTDFTASALNWMISCLIVHERVQGKVQEEIDRVVGRERAPCLADKAKMPYVEAVIMETLRYSTLTPFGGLHKLLRPVTFQGYNLPRDMLVIPNVHHVHNDKSIWGDPKRFRPSRFLENGGEKLKSFVFAFPPGKRSCPGEQLGKDILFLIATRLLQKFTFSADLSNVKDKMEYLEPTTGFILYPKRLPVIVTVRKK